MTRYCRNCSKRIGPGHFCGGTLHRKKDDKLFVWTWTDAHQNVYTAADGEETRLRPGTLTGLDGSEFWQVSNPEKPRART